MIPFFNSFLIDFYSERIRRPFVQFQWKKFGSWSSSAKPGNPSIRVEKYTAIWRKRNSCQFHRVRNRFVQSKLTLNPISNIIFLAIVMASSFLLSWSAAFERLTMSDSNQMPLGFTHPVMRFPVVIYIYASRGLIVLI